MSHLEVVSHPSLFLSVALVFVCALQDGQRLKRVEGIGACGRHSGAPAQQRAQGSEVNHRCPRAVHL